MLQDMPSIHFPYEAEYSGHCGHDADSRHWWRISVFLDHAQHIRLARASVHLSAMWAWSLGLILVVVRIYNEAVRPPKERQNHEMHGRSRTHLR